MKIRLTAFGAGFGFLDVVVNTMLFIANILANPGLSSVFSPFQGLVDLFSLALLRMFFFLRFMKLHYKMKAEELDDYKRSLTTSSIVMLCFSPIKFLLLIDNLPQGAIPPILDIVLIVWSMSSTIILIIYWNKCCKSARAEEEYRTLDDLDEEEEDEHLKKGTFEIMARLSIYYTAEWALNTVGLIFLAVYSLSKVFIPYYTGKIVALVVESKSYSDLTQAVIVMAATAVIGAFSGSMSRAAFELVEARINRSIRKDLMTSLVNQEIAFFDRRQTGEILSRLTADCQVMSDTVANCVSTILKETVMFVGSMTVMMLLNWQLATVSLVMVPIIFIASNFAASFYEEGEMITLDAVAKSNVVVEEVCSSMRTVRSFACENVEGDRYWERLTDTVKVTRRLAAAALCFYWVSECLQTLNLVAVLWYGGHLVLQKRMKGEFLVSFLLYQVQTGENLKMMEEMYAMIMMAVGASRKVLQYIDRIPRLQHFGSSRPSRMQGRIEFRGVHFAYPTRPEKPVLSDLSFVVNPGETVALVGPSGAGKSSCIHLLEGFYHPDAGQVLIDGILVHDYDYHYIHRKMALVGQEPVLFEGTVTENIRYGCGEKSESDCIRAAKHANAHNFIMETTLKYRTNVGERGTQLSGGQKQRIAIARALVREPAILLLDEATSALDTESEHLVQEAIYNNLAGKTVIIIAHRLSTVTKANRIVVIHEGRVAQTGTHEELLAQGGIYANLVKRQMMEGMREEEEERREEEAPIPDSSDPPSNTDSNRSNASSSVQNM